jgi:hypothetical protein
MLKTIVERIFEHCECPVPEFQSDEDAVNRLGLLLKKVEGNPLLLVLDDVWSNSETLVEKLQFQISDFKILVTSRIAFSRLSTTCVLKPLVHEDAVKLFYHYAHMEKNSSDIIDKDLVEKVLVLTFLHMNVVYYVAQTLWCQRRVWCMCLCRRFIYLFFCLKLLI